jgi:hypothetical protein
MKPINLNATNAIDGYTGYFESVMPKVNHIDGTFLEAGFGEGKTARIVVSLMNSEKIRKRNIWLFDSFEGFPAPTKFDHSPSRKPRKGQWKVPIEPALALKNEIDTDVEVVKGYFEDTIPSKYSGESIAILHLDGDLYSSYKSCLEGLYDKVQPGGLILFDEYKSEVQLKNFPGASIAIDEFLLKNNIQAEIGVCTWRHVEKFYMFKPE